MGASAVKMGWLTLAPYDHMPSCEVSNDENAVLRPKAPPPDPVKDICGKLRLGRPDFGVGDDKGA